MMKRTVTFTLAIAAATAAAGAGCGKKKDQGEAKVTDQSAPAGDEAAKPAKKPVTADFFGKAPAPLGALTKVKWGTPGADAKKAAPELFPTEKGDKPDKELFTSDDPALDGVGYDVGIDKETGKVDRMYLTLPGSARKLIEGAWGPGKEAKDSIGRARTFWFNPDAGWRAYLEKSYDDEVKLELRPYLPAAKLLGDGGDTLGFAPQGILGATLADLHTRFPDTIEERSQAQAAADQKKVGDFVGKDLDKTLGAAQAEVRIILPATEWAEYWTRVEIDWGKDGKVEDTWFTLPYEAYGPAKDEILALITKKWGPGKEIEYLGDKGMLVRDQAPYVIVTDDTISKAWNVRLTSKKPD